MLELMVPELKMSFQSVKRNPLIGTTTIVGYLGDEIFYKAEHFLSIEELYLSYKDAPLSYIRSDFVGKSRYHSEIYDIFRAGDKRIGKKYQQIALLFHAGEPCCRVIKARLDMLKEKRMNKNV